LPQSEGELIDDFQFARQEGALHVLNTASTAATTSLTIAREIVNRSEEAIAP
jgi:hypothetical protein